MHGHVSSNLSRWSHQISSLSGSIVLLLLPLICSVPIAICNCLHANIIHISSVNRICIVQYNHGLLIGLLLAFYILPLFVAFFLHGKLIYFIRSRHHPVYLTKTDYLTAMQRRHPLQLTLSPRHQRVVMINPQRGSSSTTTTSTLPFPPVVNHLCRGRHHLSPSSTTTTTNSSQSSRSSSAHPSSIILYKINSQANANANRTVLLLVLLLSFYVFCWAPYNIYTWHHAYQLTPLRSLIPSRSNNNQSLNLHADLRRIIFVNYSLYLLSMVSMCFSFLFYFSLNKQAREEFSRLLRCLCPKIRYFKPNDHHQRQQATQCRYKHRSYHHPQQPSARIQPPPRHRLTSTRTFRNYEFQIQCCS